MKITEIRTRVVHGGKTVPLPPHFCTNPMDLLAVAAGVDGHVHLSRLAESSKSSRDDGLVGIGNAALAPQVTKQVIDLI